jgi:small subunit ribosomal protein S3
MGQKVHPIGFRVGVTQPHLSSWYAKKSLYPLFIREDQFIRHYFDTHFPQAGLGKIEIARDGRILELTLHAVRPKGLFENQKTVDKVGAVFLDALKDYRRQNWTKEVIVFCGEPHINITGFVIENPSAFAFLLADDLVQQLEKRIPFRRAMKSILQRAERDRIPGIKVQVSGRLNGAEIARTEWARKGRVPLHTLDAKIDYCAATAKTIYGLLGVKIWLYLGDSKAS